MIVPGDEAEGEADITFNVYESKGKAGAPVFVMHHGAGLAALSFALTAREIKKLVGDEVGLLSFDARGHGKVHTWQCSMMISSQVCSLIRDFRVYS